MKKEELVALQQRWLTFLKDTETEADQLLAAAWPELEQLLNSDLNVHDSLVGLLAGKINNLLNKAEQISNEQIFSTYIFTDDVCNAFEDKWRTECLNRWIAFRHKLTKQSDALYDHRNEKIDLDRMYSELVAEFESLQNTLTCTQCGSPLRIDKMFFLPTYVNCPACNTQNTFYPSPKVNYFRSIIDIRVAAWPTLHPKKADDYTKYRAIIGAASMMADTPSAEDDSPLAPVHGISFYDYTAAGKAMSMGIPLKEIFKLLGIGIEIPVWIEVSTIWAQRQTKHNRQLGKLFMEYWEEADDHPKLGATLKKYIALFDAEQ